MIIRLCRGDLWRLKIPHPVGVVNIRPQRGLSSLFHGSLKSKKNSFASRKESIPNKRENNDSVNLKLICLLICLKKKYFTTRTVKHWRILDMEIVHVGFHAGEFQDD